MQKQQKQTLNYLDYRVVLIERTINAIAYLEIVHCQLPTKINADQKKG